MKKLVICDLDGTLMPYGKEEIDRAVKEKIGRIIKSGGIFTVSSGRDYSELKALLSELHRDIFFICADGAYAIKEERVFYSRQIPFNELNLFIRELPSCILHGAFENFAISEEPEEGARVLDRRSLVWQQIYKITGDELPEDRAKKYGLRMHRAENGRCDYVLAYANKGAALSALQTRLGISVYDTMVVGDGGNDVPMAKVCARSFAIKGTPFASAASETVASVTQALDIILSEL